MYRVINEKLINEIYQNVRMAIWAIDCINEYIKNEKFSNLVKKQDIIYQRIETKCEEIANKLNIELKDINPMLKGMSWMKIKLDNIINDDDDKIAEKLIQGTTMGVTQIITAVDSHKEGDKEIVDLGNNLRKIEEEFIESLKVYLVK